MRDAKIKMDQGLNRTIMQRAGTSCFGCFRFQPSVSISALCVTLLLLASSYSGLAQNTIGLISYDKAASYDGYNLLYPHNQSDVFLIDNCGRIVHSWPEEDIFVPGNSAYITEEGHLIKCKRRRTSAVNDPIWAGGGGETVEVLSWDNEQISEFTLNDSLMRLHHDIAPMPNGNVLMIAWENKTREEAIIKGRDPSTLAQDKLWPEVIIEWDPIMDSIVWTWSVWDHLIQDFDANEENFGIVGDHPELIDINYDEHDGHPDWLHINAIDYNPVLDQIVMSVPYFNEFWIIDHSTSTEEAAGTTGGNAGKGGDLLYRWGNTKTYDVDGPDVQKLFFQHDVHWPSPDALAGDPLYGKIVLYNNRVEEGLSTANILKTPISDNGASYSMTNGIFAPNGFDRVASHPQMEGRSNSSSLSSAQLLPNDNLLICAGRWGFTYELTPDNEVVWEYITPIKTGQRAPQGDTTFSINNNLTFRAKRYGEDFVGFMDRDLIPGDYIELDPDTSYCNFLITDTDDLFNKVLPAWPNPTSQYLNIELDQRAKGKVWIYDTAGRLHQSETVDGRFITVDVSNLRSGVYFIKWEGGTLRFVKT